MRALCLFELLAEALWGAFSTAVFDMLDLFCLPPIQVYDPCVLVTKKRYVGDMYESPAQCVPELDVKGLEIVRRDTCPLVAKTFERCLHILFRKKDLSLVKAYLVRQLSKVLADKLALHEFIFAKEVRFGTYAREYSLPPSAVVASRMMMEVSHRPNPQPQIYRPHPSL